jgi:hypothetical protein
LEVYGAPVLVCLRTLNLLGMLDSLTGDFPGAMHPLGEIDCFIP